MNAQAERHLSKAEGYLAKGEDFFEKAAKEIIAAKEADPALTNAEIGERFERTESWVREVVMRLVDPDKRSLQRETQNRATARSEAKRMLREAPMEQVEQIISELPADRQRAVAAAAGHQYLGARQKYAEEEARLTLPQQKEREAAKEAITAPVRHALGGFSALDILGHLEQALEELREAIASGGMSNMYLRRIGTELEMLVEEYNVACAMVGLQSDLEVRS